MSNKLFENLTAEKKIKVDDVREELKKIIKKNNKFNLRDLSRSIGKNDAYLQQYLYRGTPKTLSEACRYKLAQKLQINIDDLTPTWLKDISTKENFIKFKNIENKDSCEPSVISISEKLFTDISSLEIKNLYYFQLSTLNNNITSIVDISINKYVGPDLYLLNDKNTLFLAFINESHLRDDKMIVKPFLKKFHSFHIPSKLLNISARVFWQSSKFIYD